MKAKSFATTEEIETGAVVDTKKRVSEVFRGLGKNVGMSGIYLRGGSFEREKIVTDK